MGAAARLLAIIPILAGLSWAGLTAIDNARADGLILEASTEMGTWAATRARPAIGTWETVSENLLAAQKIAPSDPTNHELQGLLGSLRGDSPEQMALGVSNLMKALELRPVSPYTWANLAEAKYHQGEPAKNLELFFERAAYLGPAEPGVQRIVADYGLAVWDEVTPKSRQAIEHVVGAGTRRNPLEMLQISERRGRLDAACRHLDGSSRTRDLRWTQLCPSREITP